MKKTETICQQDIDVEDNEFGDGGDSDIDGDNENELHGAFQKAMASRLISDTNEETVDLMRNMILFGSDKGMDERMALSQVPDDWVDPEPKTDQEEPIFKDVDNPGKWSSFSYRPVFGKE